MIYRETQGITIHFQAYSWVGCLMFMHFNNQGFVQLHHNKKKLFRIHPQEALEVNMLYLSFTNRTCKLELIVEVASFY